jgi:hypothetical protein
MAPGGYDRLQFRYLGTNVTNQNLVQEEIKRRLNSGNAFYHSVMNLLFYHLVSKNVKIRICKTIILPVFFLRGCETWSLTLREDHRPRAFGKRVLRRIFAPKRDVGGNCIMRSFVFYNLRQV